MNSIRWECPKCGNTLYEGDVPYTEAICRQTLRCRHFGGIRMTRIPTADMADSATLPRRTR